MQISKAYTLMSKALDYRAERQDLISANIANVDTPFYKSRDISFENVLRKEASKLQDIPSKGLQLAKTNGSHMNALQSYDSDRATIFLRDGHMSRNDGNSVDLDTETTEMAKNSIMYNALIGALKKDGQIFRSVLDASSKI